VIQDLNLDFQADPEQDVWETTPKMQWIHSVVSTSYFVEFIKSGWWLYEKC